MEPIIKRKKKIIVAPKATTVAPGKKLKLPASKKPSKPEVKAKAEPKPANPKKPQPPPLTPAQKHQQRLERNRKRREAVKPDALKLLEHLRETYPVFAQYQPLEIGIHKAVAKLPFLSDYSTLKRQRIIHLAFKMHCFSKSYLTHLIEGTQRYSLQGEAVAEINEGAKEDARKQYARFLKMTQRASKPDSSHV